MLFNLNQTASLFLTLLCLFATTTTTTTRAEFDVDESVAWTDTESLSGNHKRVEELTKKLQVSIAMARLSKFAEVC
jgi:hypothetical protein